MMDPDPRARVRRIYCVGRNYSDHAREMGWTGAAEPPFYFAKFPDALIASDATLPYPPETRDFHHEGELVAAIGARVVRAGPEEALAAVAGYAAGLDMTRRDLQRVAREAGRPWDLAKNFDGAAVAGPFTAAAHARSIGQATLSLTVNGALRQQGRIADMIFSVAEVIADLSRYGPLLPGDLVYTGTPAGVGPVVPGDRIEVVIDGLAPCLLTIGEPD